VIHQIDPAIGMTREATMTERVNESPTASLHRSSTWMIGGFAAVALVLAVVGLYGVIAYSVSQRTREIGIRMALGAERKSVLHLILKEAGWLTTLGITLGLFFSMGTAWLIRGLLFGTGAWDAPTLGTVAAILSCSALLASYVPARRATKVDTMTALRYE
jgi:ABC-type antimicrobial peptide transport system permease subunit